MVAQGARESGPFAFALTAPGKRRQWKFVVDDSIPFARQFVRNLGIIHKILTESTAAVTKSIRGRVWKR